LGETQVYDCLREKTPGGKKRETNDPEGGKGGVKYLSGKKKRAPLSW